MAIEDPVAHEDEDEAAGRLLYFEIAYDVNLFLGRLLPFFFSIRPKKNQGFSVVIVNSFWSARPWYICTKVPKSGSSI